MTTTEPTPAETRRLPTERTGEERADDELTDDELTALALAADPDAPLPADAVPYQPPGDGDLSASLLPGWYMPAPVRVTRTPARTTAAILVVAGLVVINVLGLCITYGTLTAG